MSNDIVTYAQVDIGVWPYFTGFLWEQQDNTMSYDGMSLNTCRLSGVAVGNPGLTLLSFDPWYNGKPHPYDNAEDYVKGSNGP